VEAALTDGEDEASEASDSEFGLSDRQLEGFWQQFSGGTFEVALDDEDADDALDAARNRTGEQVYSEYGLSDDQFGSFGRLCNPNEDPLRRQKAQMDPLRSKDLNPLQSKDLLGQKPRLDPLQSKDPLGYLLQQRKSLNELPPQELPRPPPVTTSPARKPHRQPREASARKFKRALMISSRQMGTVTWYLFRIYDRGEERFYMKRYSDFRALHAELEAARQMRRQPLPELPEAGIFGIRNILDSDFLMRRREALERYVDALFVNGTSVSDDPLLEALFGRSAPGRIRRNSDLLDSKPL
jgi:hypothetical protein